MSVPLSLQPIPYQGSKRALAPRICSLFPDNLGTLYEPFAGSAAITLYAASHDLANCFVIGDSYVPLADLWRLIINAPAELSDRYEQVWRAQFVSGPSHFNEIRAAFNEIRDPVLLLYLIARCVKNAVRFNGHGAFTQSVDKRRTGMKPDRVFKTVHAVSRLLKGRTEIRNVDFRECTSGASAFDLVYLDPPYQGTTYGRDKRYAAGLSRDALVTALHDFDRRNVRYLLSYDGRSGDKVYGDPLPSSIDAEHLELHAGRSSQATLVGRSELTVESLYVSRKVRIERSGAHAPQGAQPQLFAA